MGLLKRDKSLAEMEEEGERADAEISLKEKKLILKRLNERLGDGGSAGFREGGAMNWRKAINWLKTH